MPQQSVSRRGFMATSGALASTALGSTVSAASADANSRLRIGFIGVGGRCQMHVESATRLHNALGSVECVAVCDVFNRYRDETAAKIRNANGADVRKVEDYREILGDPSIDAVVIATPDHWHAKQTIEALEAGKHVYCEKPMTHTVDEALAVYRAWKASGKVMQVGVQSTSLPVWSKINEDIRAGKFGKILQYQTEYYRNSVMGQWRYYTLAKDMNPKNINWDRFLGHEQGLAPKQPFDRARFAQWRCYWDFGSGMYTDLFVHRTTSMLKATGLSWPGRVVGGGGLFLEHDGREAPDVATVVTDFHEGVQGLVTATMCSANAPIKQVIRGHHGSAVLGNGELFEGYDFVAERPQVTRDRSIKTGRVDAGFPEVPPGGEGIREQQLTSYIHFKNFVDAAIVDDPDAVNCSPELGAAAMVVVKLGAKSYREDRAFYFDPETLTISDGDGSWAKKWEQLSYAGGPARHVPGWTAGDTGSKVFPRDYQELAGPWVDGVDPAGA